MDLGGITYAIRMYLSCEIEIIEDVFMCFGAALWIGQGKSDILGLERLIASLMNMHGRGRQQLHSCFGGFSDATAAVSVMRPIEREMERGKD